MLSSLLPGAVGAAKALALGKRIGLIRKTFRFGLVALPITLIAVSLLLVLVVPAIWASLVSDTAATFLSNYLVWRVIAGSLGLVIKLLIAPSIRSKSEGGDFLLDAARSVWRILQKPIRSYEAPKVRYLVFSHSHDLNVCRLGVEKESPWYVNTGSWLHCVSEVESWDRLEMDFTYLHIVLGQETEVPGLYRWNRGAGRPERLRRRLREGEFVLGGYGEVPRTGNQPSDR